MSGWYPDPGGEPNRYRYWDGATWSDQTGSDPSEAPPAPPTRAVPPSATSSARRPPATLLVTAAVVLVSALIVAWLVREPDSARPYTNDDLPSTSVSGGDDSTPRPTPRSPSASRAPARDAACVSGEPNVRENTPTDGRVHGGNLPFPAAAEFDEATNEPRFSFAWDVSQQVKGVHDEPGWLAQLAVGGLRAIDGFDTDPRRVAEQVLRCTITSNMYEPYAPTRRDRRSTKITVDGAEGWLIETDVRVAAQGLPFAGDRVHLVILPDGEDYGFFFSATPIGDASLAAVAGRAQRALNVS